MAKAILHSRGCEKVVAAYNRVASQKVDGLAVAPVRIIEVGNFSPQEEQHEGAPNINFGHVSLDQLRPLLDSFLYLIRGVEVVELWKREGFSYVECAMFDREQIRNLGKNARNPDRKPSDSDRQVLWRAEQKYLHEQKSLELRFTQGSYIRLAVWSASPRI
ncbi:hypothetical protein ACFY4K_35305 [Streptomyces leeuwenhoekii]|uniref:hypothetical protein n=1 Tax=Streptomyces leeuwenhoekii TaxID=1437453 RepID=UPI0036A46A06